MRFFNILSQLGLFFGVTYNNYLIISAKSLEYLAGI